MIGRGNKRTLGKERICHLATVYVHFFILLGRRAQYTQYKAGVRIIIETQELHNLYICTINIKQRID